MDIRFNQPLRGYPVGFFRGLFQTIFLEPIQGFLIIILCFFQSFPTIRKGDRSLIPKFFEKFYVYHTKLIINNLDFLLFVFVFASFSAFFFGSPEPLAEAAAALAASFSALILAFSASTAVFFTSSSLILIPSFLPSIQASIM